MKVKFNVKSTSKNIRNHVRVFVPQQDDQGPRLRNNIWYFFIAGEEHCHNPSLSHIYRIMRFCFVPRSNWSQHKTNGTLVNDNCPGSSQWRGIQALHLWRIFCSTPPLCIYRETPSAWCLEAMTIRNHWDTGA